MKINLKPYIMDHLETSETYNQLLMIILGHSGTFLGHSRNFLEHSKTFFGCFRTFPGYPRTILGLGLT